MSNISPYGRFTGRRLYSSSKIDNEIEEVLHRQMKLEPYLRMPSNPNDSIFVGQRAGHNYRAEWLREAKELERGLLGTEDDRSLKERIFNRILRTEKGLVRTPGHLALIPRWSKIGERTFKRYFGIDYIGGIHQTVRIPTPMERELAGLLVGGVTRATTTSGFQEAINYLSTQGTNTSYAQGGVLEVFPGAYSCTAPWQLPTSTSTAFDFTIRGGGKSNTSIAIAPQTPQTAAIAEGYTSWIKGIQGPRFVLRDLNLNVSGTYTGTTAPLGDNSHGGVISLHYYSTFFEHVMMSINVTLTAVSNLLKCGTYAGPSQPCTWNDFDMFGYASANLANCVTVWFEGFSWRGGLISLMSGHSKGGGLDVRSNGPNYVGQIDSYDYLTKGGDGTNNWSAFITPAGTMTLDEIEYPYIENIGTTTSCGSVYLGSGNGCVTIIGIETESADQQGDPAQFGLWNGGIKSVKTIGFGLGLQSGAQWIPTYLTGPFNNNIASVGYLLGTNTYNGVLAPTASTYYVVSSDLVINSSSGTGVSITIKDPFGNVMASGLTTLSLVRLTIGQRISWGGFSVAPTVSVYQVGG